MNESTIQQPKLHALKNGPIPASFCLFLFFSRYNFNTNVLGIRTLGRRMVGTDETTKLWQPPSYSCLLDVI